jgi:hypothetical protein
VFAGMFPATVHMDIMFIDPHQESELAKLCKPFFGGAA